MPVILASVFIFLKNKKQGTILKITTPVNLFFAIKKNIHTFTKNFVTKKVVIWKTHSNSGQ